VSQPSSVLDATDALIRICLRSGEGHRVTVLDSRGEPVVSIWAPSASKAWVDANTLDQLRRRNLKRDCQLVKGRAA